MITFTPAEAIGYLILTPIALMVILMALIAMTRIARKFINLIVAHKEFKKLKKEMDVWKANGGIHQWIKVPTDVNEDTYVCSITGWCPSLNGFFRLEHLQKIVDEREEAQRFTRFKNEALYAIAKTYGLKTDEIYDVYDRVISIKRDYKVKKLDNLQHELKDKAKEVESSFQKQE